MQCWQHNAQRISWDNEVHCPTARRCEGSSTQWGWEGYCDKQWPKRGPWCWPLRSLVSCGWHWNHHWLWMNYHQGAYQSPYLQTPPPSSWPCWRHSIFHNQLWSNSNSCALDKLCSFWVISCRQLERPHGHLVYWHLDVWQCCYSSMGGCPCNQSNYHVGQYHVCTWNFPACPNDIHRWTSSHQRHPLWRCVHPSNGQGSAWLSLERQEHPIWGLGHQQNWV